MKYHPADLRGRGLLDRGRAEGLHDRIPGLLRRAQGRREVPQCRTARVGHDRRQRPRAGRPGARSPTARSPRRPSSSAATTCSTWPTSTRRSRSPRACRPPPRGPSRSARSSRWKDCRRSVRYRPPWATGRATPFLLLCYDDEAAWEAAGPQAVAEARAEATALARRLSDEGRYLGASPLHPAATATCVCVRGGRRLITDGPFAETHEALGGYYLILAEDRATAIRLATQHPGARVGTVEVRPLFDLSRL